jgi:hypothetical protein
LVAWSDGGSAAHAYRTPASPSTLTATLAPAPSVPRAVSARQTAGGSATISWSPPSSAGGSAISGYRVTRDGVDSAGKGAYASVQPATARRFTLNRLVVGRIYTLTVAAVNAQGTGVVAPVRVSVLGPGLATAPTAVSVRPTTGGAASISWSPPTSPGTSPVTGYRVSRDGVDAKGGGLYSAVVSPSTRSFSMSSLVANRTYTVTVQAVTAAGHGALVGGQVVPGSSAAISAPSLVSVQQVAAGQVTIAWKVPLVLGGKTVTGYRVARDGIDPAKTVAYSTVVPATQRSFTMNDLVAGRAYALAVQAVVSTGEVTPVSGGLVWTTS